MVLSLLCRHPATGYVQGINDLVTPFLAVFLSEHFLGPMEDWDIDSLAEERILEVGPNPIPKQYPRNSLNTTTDTLILRYSVAIPLQKNAVSRCTKTLNPKQHPRPKQYSHTSLCPDPSSDLDKAEPIPT